MGILKVFLYNNKSVKENPSFWGCINEYPYHICNCRIDTGRVNIFHKIGYFVIEQKRKFLNIYRTYYGY